MDVKLLLIVAIMLLVLLAVSWPWYQQYRRHQQIAATAFPTAWRKMLRSHLPFYRYLPSDIQLRLKKLIQLFLAEKQFIGCDGLVVTEQMRLQIAAQACLLMVNRTGPLYPSLQSILIYPSAFAVKQAQTNAMGVVSESIQVRLGESWQQGKVILSWLDSQKGAASFDDGQNVVIHEFAHQLDQENGGANGAPRLPTTQAYRDWSQVFTQEFELLQRQLASGQQPLFDPYAATNPAEFFAVSTELFFEKPQQLQAQHRALYQQLQRYYQLDPAQWFITKPLLSD